MMRIAVCDDNTEFLNRAVDMVKKWSDLSGTPVEIYSFDNGDSLLAKNASVRMDVVFLDIIMPLQTGMDAARELRRSDNAVKIIFLTSSPEFALESYEVKAQCYLLKPVSYEKIKEVLDDVCLSFAEEPKNNLRISENILSRYRICRGAEQAGYFLYAKRQSHLRGRPVIFFRRKINRRRRIF